jgi:hypothetical protein
MLKNLLCRFAIVAAILVPAYAHGHGTPIRVEAANNKLVVSAGIRDLAGFAPMIFVEDDEDGEPFGQSSLSGFGPATLWQIPGYDIFGLQENSGLFVEPLARPVKDAVPSEHRVLWYWNPETQLVDETPSTISLQIRKTASLNTTLLGSSDTAPPPLQLAAPVASDMGFHNHLVLYAINDPAPIGAYGFFARLTSNLYSPSDPFLMVINNGIFDYEQMVPAAIAINAAAMLPGDFNRNGTVDAADYTVWRNGLGADFTPDGYLVWKNHFGQTTGGASNAATNFAAIPEPPAFALSALAILETLLKRMSKARSPRHRSRLAGPPFPLQSRLRMI